MTHAKAPVFSVCVLSGLDVRAEAALIEEVARRGGAQVSSDPGSADLTVALLRSGVEGLDPARLDGTAGSAPLLVFWKVSLDTDDPDVLMARAEVLRLKKSLGGGAATIVDISSREQLLDEVGGRIRQRIAAHQAAGCSGASDAPPDLPQLAGYLRFVEEEQAGRVGGAGLHGTVTPGRVPLDEVYVELLTGRPGNHIWRERGVDGRQPFEALVALLTQRSRGDRPGTEATPEAVGALVAQVYEGVVNARAPGERELECITARLLDLNRPNEEAVERVLTTIGISEAVAGGENLLLVGAPGSGKSTALMRIALDLARAHDPSHPASVALTMGFDWPFPIPVLLPLRQLAVAATSRAPKTRPAWKSIFRWLADHLADFGAEDALTDRLLRSGRLLVLLDGLDEIPHATRRRRVAAAVASFVTEFPACRYVLTSRPSGLDDDVLSSLGALTRLEVQPLDDDQVRRFCELRFKALEPQRALTERMAEDLTARLFAPRGKELLDLARTPVILTTMVLVRINGGTLPEARAELFDECVKSLCHRLDRRKDEEDHADTLSALLTPSERILLLESLAREVHERHAGERAIQTGPALQVLAGLASSIKDFPSDGDDRRDILDFLAERSGLLVPRDQHTYEFRHLQFQEFLTARAICNREGDVAEVLGKHLDESYWREVVVLALGYKGRGGDDAQACTLLRGLINVAAPKGAQPGATPCATVARATLDLLRQREVPGLRDVALALVAPLRALIEHETQPGTAEERLAMGDLLGMLGDPRFDSSESWLEIGAGRSWRGSSPGDKLGFDWEAPPIGDDGEPEGWVETSAFAIRRWPVTVAEFAGFVDANDYAEADWWDQDAERPTEPSGFEVQRRERPTHPITGVSWFEARAYCRWLTARLRDSGDPAVRDGRVIRLPTEVEWEKAARAGDLRRFPWGDSAEDLGRRCNGVDAALEQTTPVGLFPLGHIPSGLWDMAGNVWEWCLDTGDWPMPSYQPVPADFVRLAPGPDRVVRGGSFFSDALLLRVSYRGGSGPGWRYFYLGFRCVSARPLGP